MCEEKVKKTFFTSLKTAKKYIKKGENIVTLCKKMIQKVRET